MDSAKVTIIQFPIYLLDELTMWISYRCFTWNI